MFKVVLEIKSPDIKLILRNYIMCCFSLLLSNWAAFIFYFYLFFALFYFIF